MTKIWHYTKPNTATLIERDKGIRMINEFPISFTDNLSTFIPSFVSRLYKGIESVEDLYSGEKPLVAFREPLEGVREPHYVGVLYEFLLTDIKENYEPTKIEYTADFFKNRGNKLLEHVVRDNMVSFGYCIQEEEDLTDEEMEDIYWKDVEYEVKDYLKESEVAVYSETGEVSLDLCVREHHLYRREWRDGK